MNITTAKTLEHIPSILKIGRHRYFNRSNSNPRALRYELLGLPQRESVVLVIKKCPNGIKTELLFPTPLARSKNTSSHRPLLNTFLHRAMKGTLDEAFAALQARSDDISRLKRARRAHNPARKESCRGHTPTLTHKKFVALERSRGDKAFNAINVGLVEATLLAPHQLVPTQRVKWTGNPEQHFQQTTVVQFKAQLSEFLCRVLERDVRTEVTGVTKIVLSFILDAAYSCNRARSEVSLAEIDGVLSLITRELAVYGRHVQAANEMVSLLLDPIQTAYPHLQKSIHALGGGKADGNSQ